MQLLAPLVVKCSHFLDSFKRNSSCVFSEQKNLFLHAWFYSDLFGPVGVDGRCRGIVLLSSIQLIFQFNNRQLQLLAMITMGQNESIHLTSASSKAAFVSPLSNKMTLSSQLGQLRLRVATMPMPTEADAAESNILEEPLPHFTMNVGAENSDPNPAASLKTLKVITQTDGGMVLASTIPNGFAVVDNELFEGKKIVATESFKKGSRMYTGCAAMLDLSSIGHGFKVNIYSEDRQLLSKHYNDNTHSVDDHAPGSKTGSESKRQVYGWDGFMNHSCDANAYFRKLLLCFTLTYLSLILTLHTLSNNTLPIIKPLLTALLYRTPTEMCYQAIALRDINIGDEVTCDYALFDYHCNGHEIEVCACGSTKCRGKMMGFQGLSLQTKVDILHMVEEEIKDKFLEEENVVVYQSYLPQGIGLVTSSEDGNHLVATRRFEIGQPLFINSAELIPKGDLISKKFVLDVDGKYILLDPEHHFIYRDGYAEMLGFDSFMDHSCAPSTDQTYVTKNEYVVRAKKIILPGDKITCDYMALENSVVNMKNLGTSSFVCKCGESNCKGALVC